MAAVEVAEELHKILLMITPVEQVAPVVAAAQ
jgi:hypothetical protein